MFSSTTKDAAGATLSDVKATAYGAKRDIETASRDMAEKAGYKLRHLLDSAQHQWTACSSRVTGEIRSHPVRSAAVALGLGVVLGAVFRRH